MRPRPLRQDDFVLGAWLIFFRNEGSTQTRLGLKYVKVSRRDLRSVKQLRSGVFAAEVKAYALHHGSR